MNKFKIKTPTYVGTAALLLSLAFVFFEMLSVEALMIFLSFSIIITITLTLYSIRLTHEKHSNIIMSKALNLKIENDFSNGETSTMKITKEDVSNAINKKMSEDDNSFKTFVPDENSITMKDVAGSYEAKEELNEIIDFLKNPKKYQDMGAKIPRGVLFQGPPGTGKTLLARAVAGEAKVKFFYNSGSEFVEKFVGVGAARIRKMFEEAKKDNEPCIIFIDEIDAIGGSRQQNGNDSEKDKTLNQLLVEMDGFDKTGNIIVIAATNRKDILDAALLRSGRFDRQIFIGLPDLKERIEVLKLHAKGKKLATDINIDSIARKTSGFSNAQLAAVFNEGALLAVRYGHSSITQNLLEEAIDRVMMGPAKKSHRYSDKERRIVAYHEAGHAVASIILENTNKVEKITIIPRAETGGYTLNSPKEETFLTTKHSIQDRIISLLSGRAAEEILSDNVTSGASGDIEVATNLARHYIASFGMSDLGMMKIDENASQETLSNVDKAVRKMLDDCHSKANEVLHDNRSLLDEIALELLEKETINEQDIEMIIKKVGI